MLNKSCGAISYAAVRSLVGIARLCAGPKLMAGDEESRPVQTFVKGMQGFAEKWDLLQCLRSPVDGQSSNLKHSKRSDVSLA